MRSDELKQELKEVTERETIEDMVEEYLRIKKIVIDSGKLCHDEAMQIAMEICKAREIFRRVRL